MKNARLDKYLGKKHAVIDFHPDPSSDTMKPIFFMNIHISKEL